MEPLRTTRERVRRSRRPVRAHLALIPTLSRPSRGKVSAKKMEGDDRAPLTGHATRIPSVSSDPGIDMLDFSIWSSGGGSGSGRNNGSGGWSSSGQSNGFGGGSSSGRNNGSGGRSSSGQSNGFGGGSSSGRSNGSGGGSANGRSNGTGGQPLKRVVVVGGGIAGSVFAKSLQYHADVVLIDQKEYFEIPWATMRSLVEPQIAEKSIINHTDYLVNGKVITASAIDVTETTVATSDGRHVAYDYLVIATGHASTAPTSRREWINKFKEDNVKMKTSSSVLIIGGGPSGVELASDITASYPQKKVTLVHNGPRLLGFIGQKAGSKALDWLRSKNVDVLLEQSIDINTLPEGDGIYITSAGEAISADCHFICVNRPLGTAWITETILKDCLDKYGQIMVDEYLRVKGRSNIFAIGDIVDIPERKQGVLAQRHALIAAKNLKQMLKGSKDMKLGKYRPSMSITMVSLGKKDAVAQLPFTTMSGFLPGLIKSRELFLRKTRKLLSVEHHGIV